MSRTLYTCHNIKGIAGTIDDNIQVNIYINLIKYKIFFILHWTKYATTPLIM
jgi:hypothetical protein